ncbi:MAG: acyltransferase [Parvibaculum sp.]|nr:acyltransferase [Parvibaculum sp.]
MSIRDLVKHISSIAVVAIDDLIVRRFVDAAGAGRIRQSKRAFRRCGQHVLIRADVVIHRPKKIEAGDNISIGEGCHIMAEGGLRIGDNVIISRDVTIYCSDHAFGGDEPLPFGRERVAKGVTIGDNVWIGMHVRILPGVTIGDGAIVGMGAVVAGDVPPLAIVAQPKFRVIGFRDRNDYECAVNEGRIMRVGTKLPE